MILNTPGRRREFAWRPVPLLPDLDGHGTATIVETDVMRAVRARIEAINVEVRAIDDATVAEKRTALTEEEETRYAALRDERAKLEARLEQLTDEEKRRAAQADAQRQTGGSDREDYFTIGYEPRAYDDPRHSYFLDLARRDLNRGDGDGGVGSALDRLKRHAQENDKLLVVRQKARDEAAARATVQSLTPRERRALKGSMFEKRVNPNRTDGQGGFFVPPAWLVDEYIDLPRFGRAAANLCRNLPLPSGTDSINMPKIATGTTAAIQTADAGTVSSTDLTDTSVNAPVRTIAGQQDVALQLLDQSPVSFDEIVFADLIADYNMKLDTQVLSGTGASGQVLGILNAGGTAVTYTDATPTLPELWVPLNQGASKVATLRKMPATAVLLDPRVWYWGLSQLDTTNRPLLMGNGNAFNAMGEGGSLESDGPAGVFTFGLPAYMDGNIPSNLGAGTNESRVIVARWQDFYLWEGEMRTRVLQEVLSNTLQVRLQIYNYVAFMANRRPEAAAIISGTGLIPAAGF